ncbi:MAG: carbamoyl-phosphate synthase (glutamine-hydrolyzing) large subunit [Candidatus Bathyarchaeia archaeon]
MREEGIETVLVNPNVATIQTSLLMSDKVYLEPLTVKVVTQVIQRENPDGILLGFGGQTALNVGVQLDRIGILKEEGVRVLGTSIETIHGTEDRELFRKSMLEANVPIPDSRSAYSVDEAVQVARSLDYPVIIRVAYTLGGGGSGVAKNENQLQDIVAKALELSPERQVLVEKYLHHWKEIEYEVMRDTNDNTITVAALENLDPLGIHTGDSIVVAPTQTLTNREYHMLRSASLRVIRTAKIVGECNIQFALDPHSEEYVAIEVNARMSRSSALASKATGYPLAYISAKLALGYSLPELMNKITGVTMACFEPALDYVVVKVPRWDFRKFPGAVDRHLGPQMKSVGEVMSIGRSFEEALQKALRQLEIGKQGLIANPDPAQEEDLEQLRAELENPTDERIFKIPQALKRGFSIREVADLSGIDPWYIYKIRNIINAELELRQISSTSPVLPSLIRPAKKLGFSDSQIGSCLGIVESEARAIRKRHGILPSTKMIDTMAAEWPARTNYCYLTYGDDEHDLDFEHKRKVILLGAGCIRIGSSVEFDYCTMATAWAMKEEGIDEIIVVNNNPETVSTDYDMSDKLYFEEVTLERVLDIVETEKPEGVVVAVGGQTPNNIALALERNGVKIIGTSASRIDRAEDRAKFSDILDRLSIPQPSWERVSTMGAARKFAGKIGYPVLIRPSYVLSGSAMRVAGDETELENYIRNATEISPEHPAVISKFIEDAKEIEVDAVCDGEDVLVGGILEHIELAGTHSGDATMITPPQSLTTNETETVEDHAKSIAREIGIRGPFNLQFLVKNGNVFVIELNLRASRSMPYTSKCNGIPLLHIGAKVMLGGRLRVLPEAQRQVKHFGVKTPTFSFLRLKGADPILGVEMNSTGEVACFDANASSALLKSFIASGLLIPSTKKFVMLSVRRDQQEMAAQIGRYLSDLGYPLMATEGTSEVLKEQGVQAMELGKISDGVKSIPRMISAGDVGLIINVPSPSKGTTVDDSYIIRRAAVEFSVPVLTRIETAYALIKALREMGNSVPQVTSLNEIHARNAHVTKL